MKRFLSYLIGELKYVFSGSDFVLDLDWDHAWEVDKPMFHNRFLVTAQVLTAYKVPLDVVDLGAGGGHLLKYLLKKGIITLESVGIDSSKTSVNTIRSQGFNALQCDIMSPDFILKNKPDFILMTEIIEHIRDIEKLLLKLKSGYNLGIIITTLNLGYLWYRLRLLFGRFPYLT